MEVNEYLCKIEYKYALKEKEMDNVTCNVSEMMNICTIESWWIHIFDPNPPIMFYGNTSVLYEIISRGKCGVNKVS